MIHTGRITIYLTHPEVNIDPAFTYRIGPILTRYEPGCSPCGPTIANAPACTKTIALPPVNLPIPEFETTADAFFANSYQSIRGWECAIDAQCRIWSEGNKILKIHFNDKLVFTGHGGVGTLLYCALADIPIDRKWDQKGGGHWFAFDPETQKPLSHWAPLETLTL